MQSTISTFPKESELIDSPHCVLAVDPGLSGAVWKIGQGYFGGLRDFKTLPDIARAIRQLSKSLPLPTLGVIEAVHAMPKQGVCSMFSFGKATGAAEAALTLTLPPYVPAVAVAPQKWQKFYWDAGFLPGCEEFDSRAIACQIFPSKAAFFKRKLDHNSADACLMAVWGLLARLPVGKQP